MSDNKDTKDSSTKNYTSKSSSDKKTESSPSPSKKKVIYYKNVGTQRLHISGNDHLEPGDRTTKVLGKLDFFKQIGAVVEEVEYE